MSEIREANMADLNDLKVLFDLYRVFYGKVSDISLAKKFIEERLINGDSKIFVSIADSSCVGFTQLYPIFSSVSAQKTWVLNDLYVLPEYRGKGIGAKLLNFAKQFVKEKKGKGLSLETARDNPAQKLYERLGWKREDEFLHYFWKA